MRKTPQHQSTLFFLLLESAVFFISGCVASDPPLPFTEYSATAIESAFASESKRSHPSSEILQRFMKDGQLCLTLDNCIHVALARNFNVRLANEALVQAETDIVQARAAMLPFIGAEASYSRLDEELGFGPMTFMDRDIYKAGLVVRQPLPQKLLLCLKHTSMMPVSWCARELSRSLTCSAHVQSSPMRGKSLT
jgi:outer membrane protein